MARTAALDARRAQLLSVGKKIFSSRSYDAVSTEEIAAEAGIS
ncbi:MAG TPA: TetR family transcriptional regulator, partial [Myxococcota bacterium]|nr:TetR family transcriptional regulator [Myxococcota bacterium]